MTQCRPSPPTRLIPAEVDAELQRFYQPGPWLEGEWHPGWVKDLPDAYWSDMVRALAVHWFCWEPIEKAPGLLMQPEWRGSAIDQLFGRMSQATDGFIPWLAAVEPVAGKQVLEIGGGTGSSTAGLARAGCRVTAVDISADFLAIAATRLNAMGLSAQSIAADPHWLDSEESIDLVFSNAPQADLIVCYALLEHLLISERINLLRYIHGYMRRSPGTKLVVWETPNRLAPFDWHTTQTMMPDVVPDDLAALYLAAVESRHPNIPQNRPWLHGQSANVAWARAGRGVSFHEFEATFGPGGYRVLQDGYWGGYDYQAYYQPSKEFERALGRMFRNARPPIPRGFCRPSLDLIIELA